MWAVCDLAMGLILSKTNNFEMKVFPSEPRIPPMYFKKHEDANFVNGMCIVQAIVCRYYLTHSYCMLVFNVNVHGEERV